jgi:hypothetical protein
LLDFSKELQAKPHVSLSITKYIGVGDAERIIEETIWTIRADPGPNLPPSFLDGELISVPKG